VYRRKTVFFLFCLSQIKSFNLVSLKEDWHFIHFFFRLAEGTNLSRRR
jgi:hypothetical protein